MAQQPFPGTITTLAAQSKMRRHLGQRVNVFIDGKFSFALDILLVEKYRLARGTEVSSELLSQMLQEDGDAKATARALHFLGYRARSESEVRTRLQRDEWPDEVIDRVLARLRENGLLNDEQFSTQWVDNRSHSRPRGARALRQELRQKGVERETIEASLPDADQELENSVAALRPKLRLWSKLEERAQREKAIQFLQRRGFSYSTAKAAWDRLQEESKQSES